MVYNVIGLMSGSAHDGLDIAFVEITDVRNDWSFEIKNTECVKFDDTLKNKLKNAAQMTVPDFLKLHTSFGRWMGEQVVQFIEKNELFHKIHFVVSHGHTVFHDPTNNTSTQIGDGASISAITGLPTIADLRNIDVALGGQGAPIVPIADQLFFKAYPFCLNIGGIANVTVNNAAPIAFDIAPANQVLDYYAAQLGLQYDDNGDVAKSGVVNEALLNGLNQLSYYQQTSPKSLSNSYSQSLINVIKESKEQAINNILATLVAHISYQIKQSIVPYIDNTIEQKMLVTGGGAFNSFLIEKIEEQLNTLQVVVEVPEANVVAYKEALAMALIGVLRWREELNVLHSATGATRSSIGGALWLGNT